MIVPRSPNVQFDGESQGWMVFAADSERGCVKTQRAQQFDNALSTTRLLPMAWPSCFTCFPAAQ